MDRKTASYHTANPHGKHSSLESHDVEFWDMVGSKSQCGGQALWAGPEGFLPHCSATWSGPALGMFCELWKFSRGCSLSWDHPHCLKALLGEREPRKMWPGSLSCCPLMQGPVTWLPKASCLCSWTVDTDLQEDLLTRALYSKATPAGTHLWTAAHFIRMCMQLIGTPPAHESQLNRTVLLWLFIRDSAIFAPLLPPG